MTIGLPLAPVVVILTGEDAVDCDGSAVEIPPELVVSDEGSTGNDRVDVVPVSVSDVASEVVRVTVIEEEEVGSSVLVVEADEMLDEDELEDELVEPVADVPEVVPVVPGLELLELLLDELDEVGGGVVVVGELVVEVLVLVLVDVDVGGAVVVGVVVVEELDEFEDEVEVGVEVGGGLKVGDVEDDTVVLDDVPGGGEFEDDVDMLVLDAVEVAGRVVVVHGELVVIVLLGELALLGGGRVEVVGCGEAVDGGEDDELVVGGGGGAETELEVVVGESGVVVVGCVGSGAVVGGAVPGEEEGESIGEEEVVAEVVPSEVVVNAPDEVDIGGADGSPGDKRLAAAEASEGAGRGYKQGLDARARAWQDVVPGGTNDVSVGAETVDPGILFTGGRDKGPWNSN